MHRVRVRYLALALIVVGCGGEEAAIDRTFAIRSIDGFAIFDPEELQNDPRAGEPSYVYLDKGFDAVRLPGPVFDAAGEDLGELLAEGDVTVTPYSRPGDDGLTDRGVTVALNDRLSFDIAIDDFESELTALALVELHVDGMWVDTAFVLVGDGEEGVAHDIVIGALLDGGPVGTPSAPFTVEVRSE